MFEESDLRCPLSNRYRPHSRACADGLRLARVAIPIMYLQNQSCTVDRTVPNGTVSKLRCQGLVAAAEMTKQSDWQGTQVVEH